MATILIVEDQQSVRQLLRVILTPEYRIVETTEATQAIELARFYQPDLILLDLNLQGHRDGLRVCRALRNDADLMLAQVPIVVLTGDTEEANSKAAVTAGANSYLRKPYSPFALLSLVSTLLVRRKGEFMGSPTQ
jgi:CheY-like chemotaxis protein